MKREKVIPPVEEILKLESKEIESYYKELWATNTLENKNNLALLLIKSPKATPFMIEDFLIRNELQFIKYDILSHKNCPLSIIESFITNEIYILDILKNPNLPSSFIKKIYSQNIMYNHYEKLLNLILKHPNSDNDIINSVSEDLFTINNFNENTDSIDKFSDKIKYTLLSKYKVSNPLIEKNLKNMAESQDIENDKLYNNFHSSLILDKLKDYSLSELFEISSYVSDFYTRDILLAKKIQQSSLGEITDIIPEINNSKLQQTNKAFKEKTLKIISNNNKDEISKIYTELSRNDLTIALSSDDIKEIFSAIKNNPNTPKKIKKSIA